MPERVLRMPRNVMVAFVIASTCFSLRATTPVILNATQSAASGDVIFLQGSSFGTAPIIEYSHNDSNWTPLRTIASGSGLVTVRIPGADTRTPDLLTFRVSNDGGTWSSPVFVNVALPLTIDTDTVSPGSRFTVGGRNLFLGQVPTVRFVDTVDGSSQNASINMKTSQHFLLQAIAPSGIASNHIYRVVVSNGLSGNSGVRQEATVPGTVTGRNSSTDYWQLGLPWASDLNFYPNQYNVKNDARLSGVFAAADGKTDDTWAIMHAIQVAELAGGGVVYMPAGTYSIHVANGCGIHLLSRVVLQGEHADKVIINYGYPEGTLGSYGVCFDSQTGVADVTLRNVDVLQQWQLSGLSINNSEVFLKRVVWNMGTSQGLTFTTTHVAIQDSTLIQGKDSTFNYLGPLDLGSCQYCNITGNIIQFTVGGIVLDGATNVVFVNNKVMRDISVAPDQNSVTHLIAANFVKDLLVLDNTFLSIGDSLPTNNDGEVINTEGGGPLRYDEFRGSISGSTPTTLLDINQNFYQSTNVLPALRAGAIVAIVSGNGLGQQRIVTDVSVDGKSITVDHAWDVQPETGSHYATFDWSAENWTIADNNLTGNYKGIEVFDGSASNLLVERNTLTDSDGIFISPSENPGLSGGMFNVISNISIIGNTLRDVAGVRPAYIALIAREDAQTDVFGVHFIGAKVVANNVTGFIPNVLNSPIGRDDYDVRTEGFLNYFDWQSSDAGYPANSLPSMLGTIFQSNTATNSQSAFYLNSGAHETMIEDSFISNAGAAESDAPIVGVTQGSTNTRIESGFSLFDIGGLADKSANFVHSIVSSNGFRALELGRKGNGFSAFASSESMQLYGQELGSDAAIVAHITLAPASHSIAILMGRSSPLDASPFASIGLTNNGVVWTTRSRTGANIETVAVPIIGSSCWLKLMKVGSSLTGSYSYDGSTWNLFEARIGFLGKTYLAGASVLTSGTEPFPSAIFDSLTVTSLATGMAGTEP